MTTFTFDIRITIESQGRIKRFWSTIVQAETRDRAEQQALKEYLDYWNETPRSV